MTPSRRGAVAVLTDADGVAHLGTDVAVPVLVHPDPRSVLGGLAATVYGNPSQHLRVIGVTGTSGKTTTTYLVEAGLRAADRVAGLIGTVGIRIAGEDQPSALTTPEAPDLQALLALMVERGVDTVVMEVSSHALSLGRVDGVDFAVGGFTNLSRDHLDFHPTMAGLLRHQGTAFRARDRPRTQSLRWCASTTMRAARWPRSPHDPVTVSATGRDADWRVEDVRTVERRRAGVLRRRPRRGAPRTADRAARPLQRRQLSARGGAARRGRGVTRAGRAGPAGRARARPVGARSTAARAFWRWSTTPTSRARCARCWKRCASRAPAAWRWCSARAATETRASASRWAGWPPNSPTWWWSPTTTRATRIPPRSARRSWPAPPAVRHRSSRSATGARPSTTPSAWARAGDVVLIAGKGHEAGQTSHGQTRPFDDRDELAGSLEALGSRA